MAEPKTEFKDLTPAGQDAAKACVDHGLSEIKANSKKEEKILGNDIADKIAGIAAWAFGEKRTLQAVRQSPNIIEQGEKSLTLKQDCTDEVHRNELSGKTPLWEPPKDQRKSEAPKTDVAPVAETPAPKQEERGVVGSILDKFNFGDKKLIPDDSILRSALNPNSAAAQQNSTDVKIQQDLPSIPNTAAQGR